MLLSQATVLDVTQTLDNPFPPWPATDDEDCRT